MILEDNQPGYFLFSLDTELGWGFFDLDQPRSRILSPGGLRERKMFERLLDVFDEFGIVATWAIVGHLFYKRCEECEICPILKWQGKYHSFDEIYKTNNSLWYGADIVDSLLSRKTPHEIGFHGYTHQLFDENAMSAEDAQLEIHEWLRVTNRVSITPRTVIFPRNVIGHLTAFQEAGFVCYRGKEIQTNIYQLQMVGKLIKHLDQIVSLSTPYIYKLSDCEMNGLVNLRSSQDFFGFNRQLELFLDSIHLSNIRLRRMINAVRKAASEKKVVHICSHPWEFRTEKDIDKLRHLLHVVSDEIGKGRLKSVGMADLAMKAKNHGTTGF
jgi:peptidoglycan/xylan/chitin deacetylase (PgdA/CDA1 family)